MLVYGRGIRVFRVWWFRVLRFGGFRGWGSGIPYSSRPMSRIQEAGKGP